MSKTLRLIIFLIFILAFLISAPIVVLYTAGYRFDLSHGRIVHTAILNLTSTPRNATVMIDNEIYNDKTPAVIDTIVPGEHIVSLNKTNYRTWKSTLLFDSREARVLGPIVLFLDEEPALKSTLSTSVIVPHRPSNRFAYVTQESSWLEVWVVDANNAQTTLLMRLPFNTLNSYDLQWSKNGTYLLLAERHGAKQNLRVAVTADGKIIDLPDSLARDVDSASWDAGSDENLYVKSGNILRRIDISRDISEIVSPEADISSTYGGQEIFLSQNGNRATVSIKEGDTASILTYLPLGDYEFTTAPEGLVGLHDKHRGRIVLIELSNREQPILLNEKATIWEWNPTGDILLYSSGFDLKRYSRSSHETQTITRLSTGINGLMWYPKGLAILYRTNRQIIAMNLDGSEILSETTLATGFNGQFWIDQHGKRLNLIEKDNEVSKWWIQPLRR